MDSKLQIISGKYRGKKLFLPAGARPTQSLARGALFNMINCIVDNTQNMTVWDVFAGSGAFGLEYLSRFNNANIIFTDNSNKSIDAIKKNLASVSESTQVDFTNALFVVEKYGATADLIFIDPPYSDFNMGVLFVKKLTQVAKPGTILVWEFEKIQDMPEIDKNWEIVRDKTYGRARFLILRRI